MPTNRDLPPSLRSRIVPGWDPVEDLLRCTQPFISAGIDHLEDMVRQHGPFNGNVLDRIDPPMLCIEAATLLHMRGIMWRSKLTVEREGTVRMGIVDAMVQLPIVRWFLTWGGIRLPASLSPIDESMPIAERKQFYGRYLAALRHAIVPIYSDWKRRWFLPGLGGERQRDRRAGLLRELWATWAEENLVPLHARIPFMQGLHGMEGKGGRRVPFRAVKDRMLRDAGGSEAYAVERAHRFLASKDGGLIVGEDGLIHPNYGKYYDHVARKIRTEWNRRKQTKEFQLDEDRVAAASPTQRSSSEPDDAQEARRLARLELLDLLEGLEQAGRISEREGDMVRRTLALGIDHGVWGSRAHHRSLTGDGYTISQPGLLKMAKRVRKKLGIAM